MQTPVQAEENLKALQEKNLFEKRDFTHEHAIIPAIFANDLQMLRKILKSAAVPTFTSFGLHILIVAARVANAEIIQELCNSMKFITDKTIKLAALREAALLGKKNIVQYFLNNNIHDRNESPWDHKRTLLMTMAVRGQLEMVKLLLPKTGKIFCNPDARDINRATALIIAANCGHADVVEYLIPFSDVNAIDESGRTALMFAAFRGIDHKEMIKSFKFYRSNESNIRKNVSIRNEQFESVRHIHRVVSVNTLTPEIARAHSAPVMGSSEENGAGPFSVHPDARERKISKDVVLQSESAALEIRSKFLRIIRILKEKGANVNIVDETDRTACSYAVTNNFLEAMEYLLPNDVDKVGKDKFNNLHRAVMLGHMEMVRTLLKAKADINALVIKEGEGICCGVQLALFTHNSEMVQLLLDNDANINFEDDQKNNLLLHALQMGDIQSALLLVERGVNVKVVSSTKETPFKLISDLYSYKPDLCEKLLSALIHKSIDINQASSLGIRPIHCVAYIGSLPLTQELLKERVEVQAKNDQGHTALEIAIKLGHVEVVKLLHEHSPETDILDLLMYAVGSGPSKHKVNQLEICKYLIAALLAKGGDINGFTRIVPSEEQLTPDMSQYSPFLAASATSSVELIRIFLENGADPLLCSKENASPLPLAVSQGTLEGLQILVKKLLEYSKKAEFDKTKAVLYVEDAILCAIAIGDVNKLHVLMESFLALAPLQHTTMINNFFRHTCVDIKRFDCIKYLFERKEFCEMLQVTLQEELFLAIRRDNFEMARRLFELGKFLPTHEVQGHSLLIVAIMSCDKFVKFLLDKGIDTHSKNSTNGYLALYFALDQKKYSAAALILEQELSKLLITSVTNLFKTNENLKNKKLDFGYLKQILKVLSVKICHKNYDPTSSNDFPSDIQGVNKTIQIFIKSKYYSLTYKELIDAVIHLWQMEKNEKHFNLADFDKYIIKLHHERENASDPRKIYLKLSADLLHDLTPHGVEETFPKRTASQDFFRNIHEKAIKQIEDIRISLKRRRDFLTTPCALDKFKDAGEMSKIVSKYDEMEARLDEIEAEMSKYETMIVKLRSRFFRSVMNYHDRIKEKLDNNDIVSAFKIREDYQNDNALKLRMNYAQIFIGYFDDVLENLTLFQTSLDAFEKRDTQMGETFQKNKMLNEETTRYDEELAARAQRASEERNAIETQKAAERERKRQEERAAYEIRKKAQVEYWNERVAKDLEQKEKERKRAEEESERNGGTEGGIKAARIEHVQQEFSMMQAGNLDLLFSLRDKIDAIFEINKFAPTTEGMNVGVRFQSLLSIKNALFSLLALMCEIMLQKGIPSPFVRKDIEKLRNFPFHASNESLNNFAFPVVLELVTHFATYLNKCLQAGRKRDEDALKTIFANACYQTIVNTALDRSQETFEYCLSNWELSRKDEQSYRQCEGFVPEAILKEAREFGQARIGAWVTVMKTKNPGWYQANRITCEAYVAAEAAWIRRGNNIRHAARLSAQVGLPMTPQYSGPMATALNLNVRERVGAGPGFVTNMEAGAGAGAGAGT